MSSHTAAEIRARLPHPVIDSDGHTLEFIPAVREELVALAGRDVAAAFDQVLSIWQRSRSWSDARAPSVRARAGRAQVPAAVSTEAAD